MKKHRKHGDLYGKSPFLMRKLTINCHNYSIAMSVYQRVTLRFHSACPSLVGGLKQFLFSIIKKGRTFIFFKMVIAPPTSNVGPPIFMFVDL